MPARVVRDGEYAQLRLQERVVAARGDRVVLRTDTTVGGGIVLDPAPTRRLERSRLEALDHGTPEEIVGARTRAGDGSPTLQARGLLSPAELAQGLSSVRSSGDYFFSDAWLDETARGRARAARGRAAASPLDPGLPLAELLPNEPWAPSVLSLLEVERRGAKAYLPGATAALGERADAASELEAQLAHEEIAKVDDKQLAAFLEEEGRIRRVGDGYAVSPALYDRGCELLPTLDAITLAAFRDALGVGRRTAQLAARALRRGRADAAARRRSHAAASSAESGHRAALQPS